MEKGSRGAPRVDAESLAVAALGFLAEEPERLDRFLALSGLTPASLRAAAASPDFLPAVLDYLAADERLLVAFADARGFAPADVTLALTAFARR